MVLAVALINAADARPLSHQQQGLHARFQGSVAKEELDLRRVQRIASNHQVQPHSGQALLVDDTDRIAPRVISDYDLLQTVSTAVFFPLVGGQKLLQVSRWNPGCQGDRFAAFLAQVGQLTLDIGRKMSPRLPRGETIVELLQVLCQHRFQRANPLGVYAKPSMLDGYSFAKLAVLRNINLAL
jgi:hypothetical protein